MEPSCGSGSLRSGGWGGVFRALALPLYGLSLLLPNPLRCEEQTIPQAPATQEVAAWCHAFSAMMDLAKTNLSSLKWCLRLYFVIARKG